MAKQNSATAAKEPPPTIEEDFLPDTREDYLPDAPTGMEDLDKEDIVIPRLRIVQPTSEEGEAGNYRLNLTGDEFKELKVVFLKATKGRVMFSSDLKEGAICGSSDRRRPAEHFESPMSENCSDCPYAKWTDRKTPPECNESYSLLGLDVETGVPFFLQTRSTGIKPTKMFLSGVMLKSRKIKAHLCDFEVTLKLKEIKNDRGRYYVPVFDRPAYLKDHPYREEAAIYAREEAGWESEYTKEGQDQASDGDEPF